MIVSLEKRKSLIFIPLVIAYLVVDIIYPDLSVALLKFILFQILFLLLPGYYFSNKFISIKDGFLDKFFFGYLSSISILFILSWISKIVHFSYLPFIILIASIISVRMIIKDIRNKNEVDFENNKEKKLINLSIISFSIAALLVIILFILPSLPPTVSHNGLFYWDDLFEVGNSWSYTRGVPITDPRVYGRSFSYHYAKSIYEGMMFDLFKIDPFVSHFYLNPIFDLFIFIYIIVFGGHSIAKLNINQISLLLICLLFTNGIVSNFSVSNSIYVSQLSYLTGCTAFILFMFFLIYYFNSGKGLDVKYLIIISLIIFSSNIFLVLFLPICLLIMFIISIVKRKFKIKELLLGIGLAIMIALARLTIYYSAGASYSSMGLHYQHIIDDFILFNVFKKIMLFLKLPYNFSWAVFMFLFYVATSVISIGFIIFIIIIFKKRSFQIIKQRSMQFLLVFFIVSTLFNSLIYIIGGNYHISQISYILSSLIGCLSIEYLDISLFKKRNIYLAIILVFFILFSARTINLVLKDEYHQFRNLRGQAQNTMTINLDEWNALEWMKKNTDIRAVFITNRTYIKEKGAMMNLFFDYTAIGGRQSFYESNTFGTTEDGVIGRRDFGKLKAFLDQDDINDMKSALLNIKANYYIKYNDNGSKNYGFKKVYSNATISIYKLDEQD